jgi:hypothetical protein
MNIFINYKFNYYQVSIYTPFKNCQYITRTLTSHFLSAISHSFSARIHSWYSSSSNLDDDLFSLSGLSFLLSSSVSESIIIFS